MGGPPGVGDAHVDVVHLVQVEVRGLGCDLLLQVLDLALLLDQGRLLVGVAGINPNTLNTTKPPNKI